MKHFDAAHRAQHEMKRQAKRSTVRTRWGIMHVRRGEKPLGPLGTGWAGTEHGRIPSCVDFWPMSFRTRAEARTWCRMNQERLAWSIAPSIFKPVKLVIVVIHHAT